MFISHWFTPLSRRQAGSVDLKWVVAAAVASGALIVAIWAWTRSRSPDFDFQPTSEALLDPNEWFADGVLDTNTSSENLDEILSQIDAKLMKKVDDYARLSGVQKDDLVSVVHERLTSLLSPDFERDAQMMKSRGYDGNLDEMRARFQGLKELIENTRFARIGVEKLDVSFGAPEELRSRQLNRSGFQVIEGFNKNSPGSVGPYPQLPDEHTSLYAEVLLPMRVRSFDPTSGELADAEIAYTGFRFVWDESTERWLTDRTLIVGRMNTIFLPLQLYY